MKIQANAEGLYHYIHRQQSLFYRYRLSERFHVWHSPDFCRFVDCEAVLYYREIQESGVPFPDSSEMLTVGGETDLRLFLQNGYTCFDLVRPYLPTSFTRILDFGAGCGRTARFLYRRLKDFEIHACDVDRPAIQFLNRYVPFLRAAISDPDPPLPYPDAHFGFIYSISVFTHFTLSAFQNWLAEIHRVLQPGCLFAMTLHGSKTLHAVSTDPGATAMLNIDEEGFAPAQSRFLKDGFAFSPQIVGSRDIDTDQYGINFIGLAKFKELLEPRFSLVDYIPGALQNWQDLAVIRKL
jgi:SAM-dependent methyltransferase